MKRGLFVIGTRTDVGKTYVTALLIKQMRQCGINAGYFKAALSGAETDPNGRLIPGDAEAVCRIAGIPDKPETLVPYIYKAAVSPHLAARWEGNPVELNVVKERWKALEQRFDFLAAEGSGGIVCPLRRDTECIDLIEVIKMTGYDAVLVADAGLGTLNAIMLTAEYAGRHEVHICGIILNRFEEGNPMHLDNLYMAEQMTGIPVAACVHSGDTRLCENISRIWTNI